MGRVGRAIGRWLGVHDIVPQAPGPHTTVAIQQEKKTTSANSPESVRHELSPASEIEAACDGPRSPPPYSLSPSYFYLWRTPSTVMRTRIEKLAQEEADGFVQRVKDLWGEKVILDEVAVNSTMRQLCMLSAMTLCRQDMRTAGASSDVSAGGFYKEQHKVAYGMMDRILKTGLDRAVAHPRETRTCILHSLTNLYNTLARYRLSKKDVEYAFYIIHLGHRFIMEFEKCARIEGE